MAIQNALEQVCGFFPDTISTECQSFVNAYAPAIINLLVQEIDPHEICKQLGLCSSSVANEGKLWNLLYLRQISNSTNSDSLSGTAVTVDQMTAFKAASLRSLVIMCSLVSQLWESLKDKDYLRMRL